MGASAMHFSYARTDSGLRITRDLVALGAGVPEDIDADENDLAPLVDLAEYLAFANFLRSPDRAVPGDVGRLCTR